MNVALWVVQIVLALKFFSTAYTHGVRANQAKIQRANQRYGKMGRPLQEVGVGNGRDGD